MFPTVECPKCHEDESMEQVLTAQSNQNVIYRCPKCRFTIKDIPTSKG
ncbi:hypothetical protein N288_08675 [Bacillus infantis NRRL B-14911]|uniref:Uncharacterized protein n=1 Tax=Bacillus infantis NRRL B-14911 TaxID=1367477 RepID=U5LAL3_9BACI|nr:hypothetical protein N288_08675 [Bacillus infantis NRRL B-14911]